MRSWWSLLLVAIVLLWPAAAAGLTPYLVKDINPIPQAADSSPSGLMTVGGITYFVADDGDTGRELWRTDGTAVGTYRLADACAGECSAHPLIVALTDRSVFFFASPRQTASTDLWVSGGTPGSTFRLTGELLFPSTIGLQPRWVASQGLLYFAADDGIHGTELWRSDGTLAGTHLVSDIRPGSIGSNPRQLTEFKGRLYFRADDGQRGPMLWKSDGTPQGTLGIRDPLPASASHAGPTVLLVAGGALYFIAPAPGLGTELWKSDGTTKGTAPFIDLVRGAGSPSFYDLSVIGSRLYFVAEVGSRGQELWTTDGTSRGTRSVTSFPRADAFFSSLGSGVFTLYLPRAPLGNRAVFFANDGPYGIEPWVSDGTPRGTRLLRDVCPGTCSGAPDWSWLSGNRIYFPGTNSVRGNELWSTDGTPEGTRIVRDICRGSCSSGPYAPHDAGGRFFFVAQDQTSSAPDLWRTDGTAAGTMRVKDFSSFDAFGRSFEGTSFGTDLLFAARDAEHGLELWRSDGTDAGTQLLSDINTRDLGGSYPTDLRGVGDTVFFFAYDGTRGGLFKSDGTDAGTSFVIAGAPGRAYPLTLIDSTGVGDKLFVVLSSTEDGSTLWRTDGTASGTLRLTPPGVRALYLHAVGDTVFFVGLDRDHGAELWKTDGTAAGTVLVKDIELGPVIGSNPAHFTTFQGRLYFTAESVFQGRELWVSDGTEAGTVLLKDIGPQLAASPELLTVHAGRLWFFAFDSEHGRELWSTDGTEAGTVLFAELSPGSDYFAPSGMVAAGTRLFFSGEGGSSGSGSLWVTDGTAAPKRIGPVQFRRNPFGESRPVLFDGELFFAGSKSGYNDVLWKTDGTEAGTVPILDRDGQVIPSPRAFQIFGGRVVFTTLGGGLWQTDGTVAGTSGIQDVAGPGESDFRELVPAGPRLFFRGYDRDHGTELWALEP